MTSLLVVGWGAFAIVGILWFFSHFLCNGLDQGSSSTNRNTVHLIIFAAGNLVWGSLVWFSASREFELQAGLDDFILVLCVILPVIIFGIFVVRVTERRRIQILEKQMANKRDKPE